MSWLFIGQVNIQFIFIFMNIFASENTSWEQLCILPVICHISSRVQSICCPYLRASGIYAPRSGSGNERICFVHSWCCQ